MTIPDRRDLVMLPVPFTFSGRLTRWGYFKATLALMASGLVPVFLAVSCYDRLKAGNTAAFVCGIALIATYGLAVLWISCALVVRRIRDIGWPPTIVVTIWLAVELLDPLLAHLFPAMATGKHGLSTPIGGTVHLILTLALIFWPSTGDDVGGSEPPVSYRPPNMPRSRVEALQASRPAAPAMGQVAMAARTGFGRR